MYLKSLRIDIISLLLTTSGYSYLVGTCRSRRDAARYSHLPHAPSSLLPSDHRASRQHGTFSTSDLRSTPFYIPLHALLTVPTGPSLTLVLDSNSPWEPPTLEPRAITTSSYYVCPSHDLDLALLALFA